MLQYYLTTQNVNITVEGQRHLDAVVGSENSKPEYVNELVRD